MYFTYPKRKWERERDLFLSSGFKLPPCIATTWRAQVLQSDVRRLWSGVSKSTRLWCSSYLCHAIHRLGLCHSHLAVYVPWIQEGSRRCCSSSQSAVKFGWLMFARFVLILDYCSMLDVLFAVHWHLCTCVGNNHIFYNPNWLPRHFCVGFLPPATVCCASMIGSCEEVAIVTWFSFLVPGDSLWWFWCLEANRFGYTVSRVLQAQNQSLSLHSK